MSNTQRAAKTGRNLGSVFGWRPITERFKLRSRQGAGSPNPILAWIPLYSVCLYILDYIETMIGTGIGIRELNPMVSTLMSIVGNLAFPIVFLMVLGALHVLVGKYHASPRLITALVLAVAGNETLNVSLGMLSILHRTGLLR